MGWIVAWSWLILFLLFLMFIITGLKLANTSRPQTIGFNVLLTVGAVCVLLCTTVLAVKIYLWAMQFTIVQIMLVC